jgi:hypothetical protein
VRWLALAVHSHSQPLPAGTTSPSSWRKWYKISTFDDGHAMRIKLFIDALEFFRLLSDRVWHGELVGNEVQHRKEFETE